MTDTSTETIAQTIRRLRLASGMTQEEVALRVGLSPQMGGKWERGEKVPRPETRLAIAGLFGVEPAELGYEIPDEYSPIAPPWFTQFAEQQIAALATIESNQRLIMAQLRKQK